MREGEWMSVQFQLQRSTRMKKSYAVAENHLE